MISAPQYAKDWCAFGRTWSKDTRLGRSHRSPDVSFPFTMAMLHEILCHSVSVDGLLVPMRGEYAPSVLTCACFRAHLPSAPGADLCARSPAHTSMGSPAHTRHSGCACDVACFRPQCAFSYDQHTTPCTVSAKVQTHSAKTAHFQHSSPNGSALWQLHRLRSWPHHHQTGELHH